MPGLPAFPLWLQPRLGQLDYDTTLRPRKSTPFFKKSARPPRLFRRPSFLPRRLVRSFSLYNVIYRDIGQRPRFSPRISGWQTPERRARPAVRSRSRHPSRSHTPLSLIHISPPSSASSLHSCFFAEDLFPSYKKRAGPYLFSQVVSNQVPSARSSLTSVFGMGTGGT